MAGTAYPITRDYLKEQDSPSAQITRPSNQQHVRGETLPVEGTSKNIPLDDDLWLIIRLPSGLWFPIERIAPSADGTWEFQSDDVHIGSVGPAQLALYLAKPGQTAVLGGYVSSRTDQHDPGMSSLPGGLVLLGTKSVMRDE
jgi:hypothetical protein